MSVNNINNNNNSPGSCTMAASTVTLRNRSSLLTASMSVNSLDSLQAMALAGGANQPLRDMFEACKTGDLVLVKQLITAHSVNARDTAGRKSTPLHFAAGKCTTI